MDELQPDSASGSAPAPAPITPTPVSRGLGWRKYALGLPLAVAAMAGGLLLGIDTPIGHRLIADALESADLGRGLRVSVARIEGSVYGAARLEGLVLRDPQGVFARVPEAAVDWRPFEWWAKGLVIRDLALRRATLARMPALRPGDPNASIWPDLDIAIDHFVIDRLTVGKQVAGVDRKIDLNGRFHLAKGAAHIVVDGRLGGEDRLSALLDAQRAKDRFALKVTYDAPKGGLLAGLSGAAVDRHVRINGQGTWHDWRGYLVADQAGKRAVTLQLTQAAGRFGLAGQVANDPLLTAGARKVLGGHALAVLGETTLDGKVLNGRLAVSAAHLKASAVGGVDLGRSRFDHLAVMLDGGPHLWLAEGSSLDNLHMQAVLDGPFATSAARFTAHSSRLTSNTTQLDGVSAQGTLKRQGRAWAVPLALSVERMVTGNATLDSELHQVRGRGTMMANAGRITSDDLVLAIPHGNARASLRADTARGAYIVAAQGAIHDWPTPYGAAQARGNALVSFARKTPWRVKVDASGMLPNPTSGAVVSVAGGAVAFSGHVEAGGGHYLTFAGGNIAGPTLAMAFEGARGSDGRIALNAKGEQRNYGPFSGTLSLGDDGPRAHFYLPDPSPTAGIRDLDVDITPEAQALRIEMKGKSPLGPFDGAMGLVLPPDGAPDSAKLRLTVRGFALSDTFLTGALDIGDDGVDGKLTASGGGVNGTIVLAPRAGGQGLEAAMSARNAHFTGETPVTIALGQIKLSGLLQKQHTTLSGDLSAQGVGNGKLFIGSLATTARLRDGTGRVTVAIGGRRGSRFDVQATADVAPNRIALLAGGNYAGQKIATPRRAVLTAETRPDGTTSGWRLAPSQIDIGTGRVVAQGLFGNGSYDIGLGLADMPLSLGDVVFADLGLGGKASGQITYRQQRGRRPEGDAHLLVKHLTRSGLVLVSRPVDVAMVSRLGPTALDLRAVASENGQSRGRLQARIDNLAKDGLLSERLLNGRLVGQLRYAGPADALWRLMAIETFDLTGPLDIAADMTGTLDDPEIRGSLASDALRLQSSASGTDITGISARGSFDGSTLSLTNVTGKTVGGGEVIGSGMVDFAGMKGGRGPMIDIALANRHAQLLARPDMAVTVSGPMRILSDGATGTIAGRLTIDKARWRLGQANAAADLPSAAVHEVNRRADVAPGTEQEMPWRLMVDAAGGRIRVEGLGMDSTWNANLQLRGGLLEPAIGGTVDLADGTFDFSSKHFDLTSGRITFDGTSPPNPRLDIAASATISNLTATVTVRGTAYKPEIEFSSVPALPEEELLARILFGDSITQISAPEALQLGAALAAFRGGGGLDPINKVRSVVGLDRLRFLPADAALGRQTSVAVGKFVGRHIYAEIVTDGRGYSATNLEFHITSWLALLGSVASNERQSVTGKVTKDY